MLEGPNHVSGLVGECGNAPSKRPMLDEDDISHGLQDELVNIDVWDKDYDTS